MKAIKLLKRAAVAVIEKCKVNAGKVAVAVALAVSAPAMAAPPTISETVDIDIATLVTDVVVDNKELILGGASAMALLYIIKRIRRGLTRGSGQVAA